MEDFPGKTCAHVVNTRGNGRHHFLSLHPACRLRVGFNCRGLGKTEGYSILYGATGQRCDLGGIMLLQSKDVNTPGSSAITLFPFPPTQYKRLISENRNASYILVIFSFFLGNGSKMLIETFSRGGILKMPPSSAEVGRNSIP